MIFSYHTKNTLWGVITLLFLFAGCKTSEHITTENTYFCQGNRPFWKANINNEEITFQITGMEKESFPYVDAVQSDDLKIFATFIEKDGAKVWLKIKIKEGSCQTSSVSKTFPYKVIITRGDDVYHGCGE